MKAPKPFVALEFTRLSDSAMQQRAQSFYQQMRTRRTVRDFSPAPIPIDVIENALRTAGTAPSGANRQPWHFAVVTNPALKRQIRLGAEAEEREFYQRRASAEWLSALEPLGTNADKPFLEIAPYLIVIFSRKFTLGDSGEKLKNYYPTESVGIATGLLIAALHHAGVATLTHTPSPMKFLNGILKRPDTEKPYMILVAGLPAEGAQVPSIGRQPLDGIASFL